jgi:acylphosphatase
MEEKVRAHIFVSGHVQGVFFREKTRRVAEELGIFGWVKNLSDGRVEAIFEGEKDKVEKMISWAGKGPPFSKVSSLDVGWEDYKGEFKGFKII